MERVTPLRHLVDMETMMSVVLTGAAVVAGLVFVVVGVFSLLSLLWGDLLESGEDGRSTKTRVA
jgi:hypothetical protein